jgi:hypothetical protein
MMDSIITAGDLADAQVRGSDQQCGERKMATVKTTQKREKDGVTITAEFKDDDGSTIARYLIHVAEETSMGARAERFDLADQIDRFLKEEANAPCMKEQGDADD